MGNETSTSSADHRIWLDLIHDVSQPLSAMLTNAEAALEWLESEPPQISRVKQALERIAGNAWRAADMVGTAAQVRQSTANWTRIDLNEVVLRIVEHMSLDLHRQRIAFETTLECTLGPVLGDIVQLERTLSNLITNGIDAMRVVRTREHRLRLRTRSSDDGNAIVVVEDSGIGIDPADLKRIFEPLVTTKPAGMGLGLSICRGVAEAHGGRLWAEVNRPHGSVFQLAIPFLPTEPERCPGSGRPKKGVTAKSKLPSRCTTHHGRPS